MEDGANAPISILMMRLVVWQLFLVLKRKNCFIGVRNKLCYVCTHAETKQEQSKDHHCYKNWLHSSQSMESDIIVEGFQDAEKKHGLRYMRMIADGDSSTFASIQNTVPVWGKDVQKVECANHACKCFRSNLEKLVLEKPHLKGKNKLTKVIRVRLTTAVRCAIRMRSKEKDRGKATNQLKHDIMNSVHHIYGHHDKCSTDFCKVAQGKLQQCKDAEKDLNESSHDNVDRDAFEESYLHWTEGTKEADMEESRGPNKEGTVPIEKELLAEVTRLLCRLADKAHRLINNFTTNLAESWMAIRMKLDGGKVFNRCNRGSWHARCFGGGLRLNYGVDWSPKVWQLCTKVPPMDAFSSHYSKVKKKQTAAKRCKAKAEVKARARKRKQQRATASHTKKAKLAYGPDALDVTPDLTDQDLDEAKQQFINNNLKLTNNAIKQIVKSTEEQSFCGAWRKEHKKRLTSSMFGEINSRKISTPVASIVKRMLYPSFKGNIHTNHGLAMESVTIKEYEIQKASQGQHVTVEKSGMVICKEHQEVAASPDGIVIDQISKQTGIIEIKNVLKDKFITFKEAAEKSTFCLQYVQDSNKLQLRRNHKYYYQCQGLLNILDKEWLDFVVRSERPYQLHVERISKDAQLWQHTMLPKLLAFYHNCLLPELAAPRHGKSPGIREPKEPWVSAFIFTIFKEYTSKYEVYPALARQVCQLLFV
jgi:hypothetical protein